VYRTWVISGSKEEGIFIFENEDDGTYDLLRYTESRGYHVIHNVDSVEMALYFFEEGQYEL
jgi:hypothetical protein